MRRDITINSLFYNIHSKLIEDYTEKVRKRRYVSLSTLILYQGLQDLRDGDFVVVREGKDRFVLAMLSTG